MAGDRGCREAVIVYTPIGRDSVLIGKVLKSAGLQAAECNDLAALHRLLNQGAGAAVLGEEILVPSTVNSIREWMEAQPPWSDFPLIVLTSGGESTTDTLKSFHRLKVLGNVTLLERPLRMVTLVSAVESALRARRRQYEVQAYIAERIAAEEALSRQAQDLARSNADLQQFAYVTSHDLQEPLRSIHSYSQLLSRRYERELDADAHEFLGFITSGASRMSQLIQDLLAYSRAINQEHRPMEAVEMDSVVEWAVQNLSLAIQDSGARIEYSALPTVQGDRIQLVQLIQNLLSNAVKYRTPNVPPVVKIEAERQGSEWLFRVQDNGIGVEPEYRDRIFGVFKRLHGKEIPGTGIGLAICRKIIEQHDGRIWMEANPGGGSTFLFTLPAAEG